VQRRLTLDESTAAGNTVGARNADRRRPPTAGSWSNQSLRHRRRDCVARQRHAYRRVRSRHPRKSMKTCA